MYLGYLPKKGPFYSEKKGGETRRHHNMLNIILNIILLQTLRGWLTSKLGGGDLQCWHHGLRSRSLELVLAPLSGAKTW